MSRLKEHMEEQLGELDSDDLEVLRASEEFDRTSKLIRRYL